MKVKDFETIATMCEPTLARMCGRYMPYHNASDYSVNSDRYNACVNAIYDITERATLEPTVKAFVLTLKYKLERYYGFRDIYYQKMQTFYEASHDYEYFRTYVFILSRVLNDLERLDMD